MGNSSRRQVVSPAVEGVLNDSYIPGGVSYFEDVENGIHQK